MNFQKATYEQLLNLKIGSPIVVNVRDDICDVALFMGFNREKGSVTALDCFMKKPSGDYVQNISEYSEYFIIPQEKEAVLRLLQKKM